MKKTCNHPKAPSNLIEGKCGTCIIANQWRGITDELLRPHALKIAGLFERGDVVYDTDGKSLLDIENSCQNGHEDSESNVVTNRRKYNVANSKCSTIFKIGDIVEATSEIVRQDKRSKIGKGERGTVSDIWQTSPYDPQIIRIDMKGRLPIGSIVCSANVPLKLISKNKRS